jgi:5,10-methylenetetrahydromethanopterin reductase
MPWKRVEAWIGQLRRLLRGEIVEIDGQPVKMMHPEGFAPARPIETPILVAASGPRGQAIARELGLGVMTLGDPSGELGECAVVRSGTVLEESESFDSPRVFEALATSIALIYHSIYEAQGEAVDALPGGGAWRRAVEAFPAEVRHLHVHEGHCVAVPAYERPLLEPSVGAMTLSGRAEELRERVAALESAGMTELVYSPAGPDIPREMRAMAQAVRG